MSTNATCHMKESAQSPPPLIQNGKIDIQAHHIGWAVTGFFTLLATIVSGWLIDKHLQWYTKKHEQRYIVRILFMVPIYSIVSFGSYLFWNQSTPLLLIRDCYESTVLTSFFYLLLMYLSPDPVEQKDIFRKVGLSKENDREALRRGEATKKWVFPLGYVRSKPRDGLYFLQIMKWGVLQYCVVRPTTTLAAVVLDYVGLYCEGSWSPGWGYVYITVIVSISVSIAMYCLIQLYVPISSYLAPHRPLLKLFSIKAVVFLTFWQATFLSLLATFGLVKDTQYMTAEDINIGIGAIMETVEMAIFAFIHIRAFSYKPYLPENSEGTKEPQSQLRRTPRWRSLGHALDFRETFRELWDGCIYIVLRWRGRETDRGARRLAVREEIFGDREAVKNRIDRHPSKHEEEQALTEKDELSPELQGLKIAVDVKHEVHVNDERQWLGAGDDYIYGLAFPRRERSAGLEEQIELELERRGLPQIMRDKSLVKPRDRITRSGSGLHVTDAELGHPKQRSWWRSVCDRISRTSRDDRSDNGLQEGVSAGLDRRPSRRISFKAKLAPTHVTGEVDTYKAVPIVESYDDLPIPPEVSKQERSEHSSRPLKIGSRNTLEMSSGPPIPRTELSPDKQYTPPDIREIGPPHGPGPHLSPAPDHVLSRLFPSSPPRPSKSDAGTSVSGSIALSTNPSSQTHSHSDRRYVRLAPPAQIVPKGKATVRTPVIVHEGDTNHLRVGDTRQRRERSRTAWVEDTNSSSSLHIGLASPHEGPRTGEGISSILTSPPSPPPGSFSPSSSRSPSSIRNQSSSPKGPRTPRSKVVLPAPIAPVSSAIPTFHSQQREIQASPCTCLLPEIRVSLAPPAKRKAVPEMHETYPKTAHIENLVKIDASSSPLQSAATSIGIQPYVGNITRQEDVDDFQVQARQLDVNRQDGIRTRTTGEIRDVASSISKYPLTKIDISDSFVVACDSPVEVSRLSRATQQDDKTRDTRLQRRGARTVRRSSAPSASTDIAGIGARPTASRSLLSPVIMNGSPRTRRPIYRSPPRFNFPRHNVSKYPIIEEASVAETLRITKTTDFH